MAIMNNDKLIMHSPLPPDRFRNQLFFLSCQRKLASSPIKFWMPHRSVFLLLTLFAEKTGVWHDKTCRVIRARYRQGPFLFVGVGIMVRYGGAYGFQRHLHGTRHSL